MSVCSHSKNTKSTPANSSASSTSKKIKDERPCSYQSGNHSKFPPRKPFFEQKLKGFGFPIGRETSKSQQLSKHHKSDRKYEEFASGSSYLKPGGNVKETAKKVSLNHLLNFNFEPRVSKWQPGHSRPSYKKGYKKTPVKPTFSKERFLLANCQFIINDVSKDKGDLAGPDVPVPWDKVEQVKVEVENQLSCPICLCHPSAAKITKCGHVYCWPCILHYLALDDNDNGCRKCPICNVDIQKDELRSVAVFEQTCLDVGSEVLMILMFRSADSFTPVPSSKVSEGLGDVGTPDMKISKYCPQRVLNFVIEPELNELNLKLAEDLEEMERVFVMAALEECERRKCRAIGKISENITTDYSDNNSEDSENICTAIIGAESKESLRKSGKDYYFYQIQDGSHIYLNGINVKCLMKEYGDLKKCPATIKAKLVCCETFIMTEELRKRHKYLSHLPLSCQYRIVELALQPPIVSREILSEFQEQIQRRAAVRQKKEKKENDLRRLAEAQEWHKVKNDLLRNVHSSTPASSGSVSVLVAVTSKPEKKNDTADLCDSSKSPDNLSDGTTKSFAEMLRSSEEISSKPFLRRPAQQLTIASHSSAVKESEDVGGDDPYYMPPAYQSSFGDALSSALNSLDFSSSVTELSMGKVSQLSCKSNKKHKQRKKQTLLFSTSAQMHHL